MIYRASEIDVVPATQSPPHKWSHEEQGMLSSVLLRHSRDSDTVDKEWQPRRWRPIREHLGTWTGK
jgi:hypothetical protein